MSVAPQLEAQLKRRIIHYTFTGSVRCGRWMSRHLACCYARKEHKLARLTSRFSGGFFARKVAGVEFSVGDVAGVNCRVYRPQIAEASRDDGARKRKIKLPVLVYIHGGGWTVCSARAYHEFTAMLARDTGAIVVSVDYSLAPELPYPHGYEDCLAVVRCLLNADSMTPTPSIAGRVDTSRVVVAGDSAGGNLAACVTLDLIRNSDRRIRALTVICPALQAVNFSLPSYTRLAPEYGLDWFVANYAGIRPTDAVLKLMRDGDHLLPEGRQLSRKFFDAKPEQANGAAGEAQENATTSKKQAAVPYRLASLCSNVAAWPLLADDAHLAQMPSTFVQSAEFCPMLDENAMFAERLRKAGASDVRYTMMANAAHVESCFPHLLKTQAAADGYQQLVSFFQQVLS